MIHLDNFDHDTDEPRKLRREALDKHVLQTAKRISIFWITETQARACRIQRWIDSGDLLLEHIQYPWLRVAKFKVVEDDGSGT